MSRPGGDGGYLAQSDGEIAVGLLNDVCVKRYGRATLTIRRRGGWAELFGDSRLAQALRDYGEERTSAAEVASAFVSARVQTHSPTFSWETADPERLVEMVTSCSTEPVFDRADATYVAEHLLKTRDVEREKLKKVGAQFEAAMQSQRAAMRQVTRSVANLHRLGAFQNSTITRMMSEIGRPASPVALGRLISEMPRLQPQMAMSGWLKSLSRVPAPAALRRATIDFGQMGVPNLSSALAGIRTVNPSIAISGALRRSVGKREFGVGEIVDAAQSAARLVGALGDAKSADVLSKAAVDADAVLDSPTLEKVCESIDRLAKQVEDNETRRQKDREEDANELLLLWVVAALLNIYLALLPYLVRS